MSRRHTPAQLNDAIARVRRGADINEVARALGVHRSTLGKKVREAAIAAGETVRKGRQLPKKLLPDRQGDMAWQDDGNCIAWPNFTDMQVEQQKRICWDGCPVRGECLEHGLAGLEVGYPVTGIVYGGLSPRDQYRLHRLRREAAGKAERMRAEVSA